MSELLNITEAYQMLEISRSEFQLIRASYPCQKIRLGREVFLPARAIGMYKNLLDTPPRLRSELYQEYIQSDKKGSE